MIEVSERFQLQNLESLLIDHRTCLVQEIKKIAPSKKWLSLKRELFSLRAKLDLHLPKFIRQELSFDHWPSTLKMQWKNFESRAQDGWRSDPDMLGLAAQKGVNVKLLEDRTIRNYKAALSYGLSYIQYTQDLNIKDLLSLEPIEVMVDGVSTIKLHNPLVDTYRRVEWERETYSKRKGYDSAMFANFLSAIKAIALFNGIFSLQSNFTKHYSLRLDLETRKKNKLLKKKVFDLEWIDSVIARLEIEFKNIVDEKKFDLKNPGYSVSTKRKSLRFCLFYISLVTLRYLGFRQQCLRNCVYGRNIIFRTDGSIHFYWDADEIKNDKILVISLYPEEYRLTHGKLIDALNIYHREIYKNFTSEDDKLIDGQFFLKQNRFGKPTKFSKSDARCFYTWFVAASESFIKMEEIITESGRILHPHTFRGLTGDWYHDVLNAGLEETAKALGDSQSTVQREYLRNDRHIVTPVISKINKELRQHNQHKDETDLGKIRLQHEKELSHVQERAELAESRVSQLLEQLGNLSQQLLLVQKHLINNHPHS